MKIRVLVCASAAAAIGLVSVCVDSARSMEAAELRTATAAAYRAIARLIARQGLPYPARVWNLIPGVLEPLGALPHRYMVFNAGRCDAYRQWLRHPLNANRFPTASGVGHDGQDLVIHCLASAQPVRPTENPRQIPAYRYSQRHGPLPPCFSRATVMDHPFHDDSRWILIGGTASVVGEESIHGGRPDAQVHETFENLHALLSSIMLEERYERDPGGDPFRLLRDLRVYVVRHDDLQRIREIVRSRVSLPEIEFVPADLCRPELLVEIEGVALLDGRSDRTRVNHNGDASSRCTPRGSSSFAS